MTAPTDPQSGVVVRSFHPVDLAQEHHDRASGRIDDDALLSRFGPRLQLPCQTFHRGSETRFADRLNQIVERLCFECSDRELVKGSEKHNCWHSLRRAASNHFKAVDTRHLDVKKNYVRSECVESREYLSAIATFTHNGKLR